MKNKKIALMIIVFFIIVAIFYLQGRKNTPVGEIENKDIVKDVVSKIDQEKFTMKESTYPKAKELESPQGYFNVENITLAEHIGKDVILVDFWTYTCINCQRTLPYLNAWHEKYKDQGLAIIGVHTPEFDFEKDYNNVKKAIEKYGIKYPVVQDNEYKTWRAYGNRYWSRKYLIDIDGFIVYDHIGEGGYEETEREIQKLLEERNKRLNENEKISDDLAKPNITSPEFQAIQTPEIYFGYDFSRNQMGNEEGYNPESAVSYILPKKLTNNKFYLNGTWLNNKDNLESINDGSITINYHSKNINLVAGANDPVNISVYIDNNFVENIAISNYDLYNLYSGLNYEDHQLEIKTTKGLRAYTFTFG